MFVNSRGDACGGMAQANLWYRAFGASASVQLDSGSNCCGFLTDDDLIYQNSADQTADWNVPQARSGMLAPRGLNAGAAGGGQYQTFLNGSGVSSSVVAANQPAAKSLVTALDGTCVQIANYQTGQGLNLYLPDGTTKAMPNVQPLYGNYPQAFFLDENMGVYFDLATGKWTGYGVPDPVLVAGAGALVEMWLWQVAGITGIAYHVGGGASGRYLAHPITDPSAGWIIASGLDTFGTYGRVVNGQLACGYATNAGESGPQGLQVVMVDVTRATVLLTPTVAVPVTPTDPPVTVTLPSYGKPGYAGCFFMTDLRDGNYAGPGNMEIIANGTVLPGNQLVARPVFAGMASAFAVPLAQLLGVFTEADATDPNGRMELAAMRALCSQGFTETGQRPKVVQCCDMAGLTVAWLGRQMQPGDILSLEAYPKGPTDTAAAIATRHEADIQTTLAFNPAMQIIPIWPAETHTGPSGDFWPLQVMLDSYPLLDALTRKYLANMIGTWFFSWGRPDGGAAQHPALQAWITAVCAAWGGTLP